MSASSYFCISLSSFERKHDWDLPLCKSTSEVKHVIVWGKFESQIRIFGIFIAFE